MRPYHLIVTALVLTLTPRAVDAQPAGGALTALQAAVACAPPPITRDPSATQLHLIGAQDTVPRRLYGPGDLLVIGGGTKHGVQLDQQYFVRRPIGFGTSYGRAMRRGVKTAGWIRIVAVNDTTAIAMVDHVCDGMLQGDYLEPFVVPDVPEDADRVDRSGELDFTNLGQIVFGDDLRHTGSVGEFLLIDRGSAAGVAAGARFAIYRDLRVPGLPLTSMGEAVVVATGPARALVRITSARDAVMSGDFVVPRRR